MPLLVWNEKLSVNIKTIDEQHKKWIEILNGLYDAMKSGTDGEAVGKELRELVEYTKLHFSAEEKLMEANDYPLFQGHRDSHEDMMREVESLMAKHEEEGSAVTMDVMLILKDRMSEHIVGADKNYGSYLNSKGVY